jgi:anti-anti-sigma regulatory factor
MDTPYTIVCEPHPADRCVTLLLNGKFDESSLAELEQSICDATSAQQRVLLDLSEVTLVDRKTVQFFSERASQGVKLVNCPIYLRRWIAQVSDEI